MIRKITKALKERRMLSLLLTVIMITGLLTGCGSSKTEPSQGGEEATTAVAESTSDTETQSSVSVPLALDQEKNEKEKSLEFLTSAIKDQASQSSKPKMMYVPEKKWNMNSNVKTFTVYNWNPRAELTFKIDDTSIIAAAARDARYNGMFDVTLYARKSGTTKITISDYYTGESVRVKVKVNLKKNKYLYIESNSITLKKKYVFKLRNYYKGQSQIYYHSVANNGLIFEWPKNGWESGKEIKLTIWRGAARAGTNTFFVLKDSVTKESAFIDVYVK